MYITLEKVYMLFAYLPTSPTNCLLLQFLLSHTLLQKSCCDDEDKTFRSRIRTAKEVQRV
jgi:hypothetical protein